MTVESAIEISRGMLITPPSISGFNSIAIEAKNTKRGDLFIAINPSEIALAISNGAYGIVFEKPTQIIDSEIAWIKVESISNAILRFIRYFSITKKLIYYHINSFQYELVGKISTTKEIRRVSNSLVSNFNTILNAPLHSIFVSKEKGFLEAIGGEYKSINDISIADFEVTRSTLFETSFRYEKRYYEFVKVPSFFLNSFLKVLGLFDLYKVGYTIEEIDYTKHFEPVFVNKNLVKKEFGESDRVLIFEPELEFIDESITFISQNLKWANVIFIFPTHFRDKYPSLQKSYFFNNKYETIEFLKSHDFNFAYISSFGFEDFRAEIEREVVSQGLFYA